MSNQIVSAPTAKERTLITGASAGIGAAYARTFARNGHHLILVARREDRLEELARELRRSHRVEILVIPADLAEPGAAEKLYGEIRRHGLEVNTLVNNAGLLVRGTFYETRLEEQHDQLEVNVVALTELAHVFLPNMIARGRGRILNMASSASFQSLPWVATYAASKAYVLSFSEALAIELKGTGVSVTALCPGFTETDMISQHGVKPFKIPLVKNNTPQAVADKGYEVCVAGKPVYVNGWIMRMMISVSQYLPRWAQRWSAEQFARTVMR